MKTKDDREYKPGMTLYFAHDGVVEERKTLPFATDQMPDQALTQNVGYVSIQSHYGRRDNAYVEATNHWLHLIRGSEAKLQALNRERNADL